MIHGGYDSVGIQGKCIKLIRANNEYVRINQITLFHTSTRFYTFWYYPTDSTLETILSSSQCSSASVLKHYYLDKDASNNLVFTYEFSSGTVVSNTIGALTLNEWHLICIGTTSRRICKISIDGGAFTTITAATDASNYSGSGMDFLGGKAARAAQAGGLLTREATSQFCNSYFDNFVHYTAEPSLAHLSDVYKLGKGKKDNRTSLYKTNGASHLTFDNIDVIDPFGKNYKFFANIYHTEYGNTNQMYLDGVDDYATGENGVNSFNISRFIATGAFSLNMLIYIANDVDFESVSEFIFSIANTSRSTSRTMSFGSSTATFANELITVSANADAGTARGYCPTAGTVLSGWHMLTLTFGTNPVRIYLDAVQVDNTGPGFTGSGLTGCTRLTLGALRTNSTVSGYCNSIFKEVAYWKGKELTSTEITDIYNYYTSSGSVTIENTTATLESNSTYYSDATLIELWKGNWASGELIASKRPKSSFPTDHHNLTINNRVLTPGGSSNFFRRRGKSITV